MAVDLEVGFVVVLKRFADGDPNLFSLEFRQGRPGKHGSACGDAIELQFGADTAIMTIKAENISLRHISDVAASMAVTVEAGGRSITVQPGDLRCRHGMIDVDSYRELGDLRITVAGFHPEGDPPFALTWAKPGTVLVRAPPQISCQPTMSLIAEGGKFVLGVGTHIHQDGRHAVFFSRAGKGEECLTVGRNAPGGCVVAEDTLNVTRIDLLSSVGAPLGSSSDAAVEFEADTRTNVIFRATNIFNLTAFCTSQVTTFSTVENWDAAVMDAQMSHDSEAGSRHGIYTYYAENEYRIDGPGEYGFNHPERPLFESFAGNYGDILFSVSITPSTPGLLFIDQASGAIVVNPMASAATNTTYSATLTGLDSQGTKAVVKQWSFVIDTKPAFRLSKTVANALSTGVLVAGANFAGRYTLDQSFGLDAPLLNRSQLFTGFKGAAADIAYSVDVAAHGEACEKREAGTDSSPGKFFVDSNLGEILAKPTMRGLFTACLRARDGAGDVVEVQNWTFTVEAADMATGTNGPNGRACRHGKPVDGAELDGKFECDCSGTSYGGANCDQGETESGIYVASVLVPLLLLVCSLVAASRYRAYVAKNAPVDFDTQLQLLKDSGVLAEEQMGPSCVPRELKRSWLTTVERLGQGNFGEVWKGLLNDGGSPGVPEYMVAAKIVLDSGDDSTGVRAAETDLLQEALLMAQVAAHAHLVSLVGVITRGVPKTVVISFCEHGELQGALKRRAAEGTPLDASTKLRFCGEISGGMAHLALHNFVHRDLAARNVLLSSGMVCKVADFGLSRRVRTEDNTGDYYRASGGLVPVRWTAPEGLARQKFSSASDVWSFGITCVEIYQDGLAPFPGIRSNPEVAATIMEGNLHPQPAGCNSVLYVMLVRCWDIEPGNRPSFTALSLFFADLVAKAASENGGAEHAARAPASDGGDPGSDTPAPYGASVAVSDLHFDSEPGYAARSQPGASAALAANTRKSFGLRSDSGRRNSPTATRDYGCHFRPDVITEYLPVGEATGIHPMSRQKDTADGKAGTSFGTAESAPSNTAASEGNYLDSLFDRPTNGSHVTPRARPADAKADAFDGFHIDPPAVAEHDRAVREMRGNAVGDTKPGAGGTPDSSGVQTLHIPGLGNVDVFTDTEPNAHDALAETTFAAGGANVMSC